jgi:hypothetical protein
LMFLDTTLPDAVITHMLTDAQPVVILTRGQDKFRDLPTIDVLTLPERMPRREQPTWLGRPHATPGNHLLHKRNDRAAQGRGVPPRRLREPGPELCRLLRSSSGHGCDLAHFVSGL